MADKSTVPSFKMMMKPVLKVLSEAGQAVDNETIDARVEEILNLPAQVRAVPHGNGRCTEVSYRIAWAKTYLKKYGWIYNPSRGFWKLSESFDEDIDQIDEKQIAKSVNQQSFKNLEREDMTNLESHEAFERFIIAGLKEFALKQGKKPQLETDEEEWDAVFPFGINEDTNPVYVDVKYVPGGNAGKTFYQQSVERAVKRLPDLEEQAELLTIFNTHISGQIKQELANSHVNGQNQPNARITIWDYEDVVNHIGSLDAHAEYLLNPKRMLVEDKLSTQLTKKEEEKKRDILIAKLRAAYNEENVTVFLGAGVSKDAGVPLWGELTSKLLLRMISERLKDNDFENEHLQEIWKLAYQNQEESPLTQMRYIRTAFDDDEYYDLVREVLYENEPDPRSALLNAIVRLSTPRRNHIGVKSIVSYNFDDLLEQNLEQAGVEYKTSYREQDMTDRNRLSIYHVHGFLPKEPEEGESQDFNLVFSEEDYHRVYRDAYGWSNLVQLNAFRDTTCLFLGCSLTDPNMRRLLDVAARTEEKARHYAVLKRKRLELPPEDKRVKQGILEEYQRIDNNIRESYYESLGINIIWVDRYDEIPGILKGLRGT